MITYLDVSLLFVRIWAPYIIGLQNFHKKEWWLRPTAIDGVGESSQSYQSLFSRPSLERKPSVLKLYPR
jgi:hypothetical protein